MSLGISVSVLAATGDYSDPATASGANWTDPTNVFLDDGNRALYQAATQDDLFVTNFSLGTSGNIDSIIIRINGFGEGAVQAYRNIDVVLTKNGSTKVGDVVTVGLPEDTDGDVIARGTTDDLWGTTWTSAEINATTFGVTVSKTTTDSDPVRIDQVQVQVWWTALSVSLSNSTFTFGTRPLDTWLAPDSCFVKNDGNVSETFKGKISQFLAGANTWAIDGLANGADSIQAQWSATSNTGPWTAITAYDINFTIAAGVAVGDSVLLWFQIETPTSTSSYNEYSCTLTVTAE